MNAEQRRRMELMANRRYLVTLRQLMVKLRDLEDAVGKEIERLDPPPFVTAFTDPRRLIDKRRRRT